mgnify:FL=1
MNKEELIDLYKKESAITFNNITNSKIEEFVDMIFEAYDSERTVFAAANGGGASYVQNLVVDLNIHPFVSEDKGSQEVFRNKFKCINLCADQATITGISNDLGFEHIFSEQLKYDGVGGDLVIGFSGSGNSKNILELFKAAKNKGMKTVLFTRNEVNKCNEFSDLVVCVVGTSIYPGQTGGNNNNFHLEDICSKITHIAVGLLKLKVQNAAD